MGIADYNKQEDVNNTEVGHGRVLKPETNN